MKKDSKEKSIFRALEYSVERDLRDLVQLILEHLPSVGEGVLNISCLCLPEVVFSVDWTELNLL